MLRSVGYDEGEEILEIELTNGAVYRYFDLPAEVYQGLMAAESHGRYFLLDACAARDTDTKGRTEEHRDGRLHRPISPARGRARAAIS